MNNNFTRSTGEYALLVVDEDDLDRGCPEVDADISHRARSGHADRTQLVYPSFHYSVVSVVQEGDRSGRRLTES